MDRRVVDALPTPQQSANHNNPDPNRTTTTTTATTMPSAMHLHTTPSNYSQPHGSPFKITPEDVETLAQSGGFAILRDHLAEHYNYDFCETHNDPSETPQHILHRDILHALLVPVIELYDKAESTAYHFTRSANPADHEYAYTSSARAAFLWLQCFLDRERDWSYTRGCPGCVVAHTLDSEFTIRLLYAACLLSDVHYPFTLDGPTLPSFIFYLASLRRALAADALWGPEYFDRVAPKAAVTRNGIEELIHQCLELDAVLSAPTTPASIEALSPRISPVLAPIGGTPGMMRVKRSKMAKQQQRLKVEEELWVEEMMRCMNSLQLASLDAAAKLDLNADGGGGDGGSGGGAESLDSAIEIVGGKGGERLAVAVNEVVPVD